MSAVNSTCGRDTAVFTKQFLDRMASPLNQVDNLICITVKKWISNECKTIIENPFFENEKNIFLVLGPLPVIQGHVAAVPGGEPQPEHLDPRPPLPDRLLLLNGQGQAIPGHHVSHPLFVLLKDKNCFKKIYLSFYNCDILLII